VSRSPPTGNGLARGSQGSEGTVDGEGPADLPAPGPNHQETRGTEAQHPGLEQLPAPGSELSAKARSERTKAVNRS